ncbi:uncharacterized protein OCT59_012941 [Rhizophagus irregularis]|uniref:Uncharacterized protein n=2 Tax=Rhizophagus irregularis TaxID=588596 RepID=A0A015IF11_RHIIW|nr:hypothetical protein RirG_251820 [Rhizophagus irregularis DAOM 197198w]UZO20518.1 hypothetical protein OCT59_012941 [Rhizophagus irregularis]GBC31875.2 hypothetical protein GLOIN_2v1482192 [Rhizophagus irregularis DAOM 181602=DAOM 197198]CAG8634862.1 13481_t:CDS:2 [Rhizophagus irregularis]
MTLRRFTTPPGKITVMERIYAENNRNPTFSKYSNNTKPILQKQRRNYRKNKKKWERYRVNTFLKQEAEYQRRVQQEKYDRGYARAVAANLKRQAHLPEPMIIDDLTTTLPDRFYQWSEDTDAYLNEPDFLLRKKKKRLNLPSPSSTDNEDAPSEFSNQISMEQDVPS